MKLPFTGSVNPRECPSRNGDQQKASQTGIPLPRCWQTAAITGALILAAPLIAGAQGSAVRARITAPVDETQLTTLRGNTHPLARAQYDQGAVAGSQPMRRMLLLLKRSPEQETALRTLLDEQQSKSSPNFHKWVTPQQFGQQFGPADADIQAVTGWLTSHGFQVAGVSNGKILIEFSGTAGQVRNAFHTEIHRYLVNGEMRFANSSDPQIPAALSPVVAGAVSLHNFPKKPLLKNRGIFRRTKASGKVTPLYTFNGCPTITGAGANCNAIGPADFATIYNVPATINTQAPGTGQTIAIVGDSEICTASSPDFSSGCTSDDVATFRSQFGLTPKSPNVILDGPDPGFNGDEIEGNLDVQWSGAIAQNATIDFVIAENTEASAGVDLAAEYIVDNNLAPVLSESFGDCESALGSGGNAFYAALWEQAAGQGITVIVASDDNGSAGCDNPNFASPNAAQNGIAVNGIGSTPFNVATGGTDFDVTVSNYQSTYWSSSNGAGQVSAKSYIPETTWNDSCGQSLATSQSVAGCTPPPSIDSVNIVAAGGGQSSCAFQGNLGNCTGGYTKPAWQPAATGSNLGPLTDTSRDVPDIALFAADGAVSNSFYIVCEADLNPGGAPCDISAPFFDFVGIGGTSSAAPTFAGVMALVNQSTGSRQGNANYVLYNIAATQNQNTSLDCDSSASGGPNSACTFNDVTKGNIAVPCVGGSTNCNSSSGYGLLVPFRSNAPLMLPAWEAGPRFDLATGLGSINAGNLIKNWTGAVGSFTATTTTLCLSTVNPCASSTSQSSLPPSMVHGTKVYVNIGVTPPSGTIPSDSASKPEAATLLGTFSGGNTSGVDYFDVNTGNVSVYPLTNGVSGGTNVFTNELVGGTYSIVARYSGDGTFGASTSSPGISVNVTPESSTLSLSVNTVTAAGLVADSSVPYGAFEIVRADVKGQASGLETGTGAVTINDNGSPIVSPTGSPQSGGFALNREGYTEDQTSFLSVGSHSITASYPGDLSYGTSAVTAGVPLTVTQGPTVTTFTFAPVGNNFTLTATVDTQTSSNPSGGSAGLAPTGSVAFKSGGNTIATATAPSAGFDVNGFVQAQWTATISAVTTPESVTAVYSGDTNYLTSTSASQTVGPTFTLSDANSGFITIGAPGQSGSDAITVTASPSFAGTVTLTAASVAPNNFSDTPACSFGTTGTITLSSGTTTGSGTLTCTTIKASGALYRPVQTPIQPNWLATSEVAALAACVFLLAMLKGRRRRVAFLAFALFAVILAGVSCSSKSGGGGGGGTSNAGTTPGTYTVTVNAASSGMTQQMQITLTVQ